MFTINSTKYLKIDTSTALATIHVSHLSVCMCVTVSVYVSGRSGPSVDGPNCDGRLRLDQ